MTPQTATAVQPVKTSTLSRSGETRRAFERMEQLNAAIARRAFEIFEGNGHWFGRDLSDWLEAESEILHPLHLEIAESDEALAVKAEVPGFAAKELDVQVEQNRLTISGKHEAKEEGSKGKTIYSERCSKEIFRSITLPSPVDGSRVNATLKDGVLSIELPKSAPSKTIPIDTKSAS